MYEKLRMSEKADIRKNCQDIDAVKVYVPAAGGSGNDQLILGQPILEAKPSVCSQTYLYTQDLNLKMKPRTLLAI